MFIEKRREDEAGTKQSNLHLRNLKIKERIEKRRNLKKISTKRTPKPVLRKERRER